ncbi:hypothetical protein VNI00_014605 [Paramarasmius palmivorus]|uniref:F-box domain-containing protein n=1 Tax=Paramarasmius palmivorus TaxID=297713 RepID=A0AAW0BRU9_9AGAR
MEERHEALVGLYLNRSARHPLRVSLHEASDWACSEYEDEDEAIRVLGSTGWDVFCSVMSEIHRCTELDYNYVNDNLIGHVKPYVATRREFSVLSSFSDGIASPNISTNARWFWQSIKMAPRLTCLTVQESGKVEYIPDRLQSLKFCWPVDSVVISRLLSRATHLKTLYIGHHYQSSEPTHGSITLPGLQHLTLNETSSLSTRGAFLRELTVPALSSLEVNSEDQFSLHLFDPETADFSTLHAMLKQSSCSLQRLRLSIPTINLQSHSTIAFLQTMSDLTHLTLEYSVTSEWPSIIPDLCAPKMVPPSNDTSQASLRCLLPRLEKLSITEHSFKEPYGLAESVRNVESIITVLESEWDSSGQWSLVDLSLSFASEERTSHRRGVVFTKPLLPLDLANRVRKLKAKGLWRFTVTLPRVRSANP